MTGCIDEDTEVKKVLTEKALREQSKQYVSSRTRAVGREQKDVDIEEAWVVAEADASP
jgi:hypothetical protein